MITKYEITLSDISIEDILFIIETVFSIIANSNCFYPHL